MYDELVKRLRRYSENVVAYKLDSDFASAVQEAADALEELSRENESLAKSVNEASKILRKRWIPVTERLPEAGERVLCYCRANIYEVMKMRTDGDWVYDTNHVYMHSFVTHWMPLPRLPKEE